MIIIFDGFSFGRRLVQKREREELSVARFRDGVKEVSFRGKREKIAHVF